MSYLLVGDLDTHIYSENRDEIVRSDNEIIYHAIDAAIDEAKSYLGRYDLLKIFGNDDTEPVYENLNLKNKVKDIAIWQLVCLANPNIKIEIARTRYEDAIAWLKLVAANKINPGFPMKDDDPATDGNENGQVEWDSEKKRRNHY